VISTSAEMPRYGVFRAARTIVTISPAGAPVYATLRVSNSQ
jgi:hypothetical protein